MNTLDLASSKNSLCGVKINFSYYSFVQVAERSECHYVGFLLVYNSKCSVKVADSTVV